MLTKSIDAILKEKGETVVSIKKDENLITASKLMTEKKVGTLIVLDEGKMAGILSERDIVRRAVAEDKNLETTKVQDIMTEKVLYASRKEKINESISKMVKQHCRHLPVLENEKIIGMISISDLMKALNDEFEEELDVMLNYVSGVYVR